jgi:hypothetical protein
MQPIGHQDVPRPSGTGPAAGLVILPLLAYHALQLVVCSSLAARWPSGSPFLIGNEPAARDQLPT